MVLNTKTENACGARAREHNLKNVDVDIPRSAVVVFTGVSGSDRFSVLVDSVIAEES